MNFRNGAGKWSVGVWEYRRSGESGKREVKNL